MQVCTHLLFPLRRTVINAVEALERPRCKPAQDLHILVLDRMVYEAIRVADMFQPPFGA